MLIGGPSRPPQLESEDAMEIREYDEVDALEVLHVNLLCLDHALTPERVAVLRRTDPRPFPFFGVYAQVEGRVVGQVGVFRLPVMADTGAQEVGGVWAVATHPAWAGRGIASRLLDEAHARMARAGLRYVTLGTSRHFVAHSLYRRLGYEDVAFAAEALATRDALPDPDGLRAEPAGAAGLALADQLFEQIAGDHLGFSRRHMPFFAAMDAQGYLAGHDLWLVWRDREPVGYAALGKTPHVLRIKNLLLLPGVDAGTAVAAVARETDARYVRVRVDRPGDRAPFERAGWVLAQPDWGVFMVKPLAAGATIDQFRRHYGVDAGRFLMSYLDLT
jgi:ribosomal protein S18 acetylase RimI-like enzyme